MDEHVDFTAMKDGTREEYELLARLEKPYLALTADRVLEELKRAGETTLEGHEKREYHCQGFMRSNTCIVRFYLCIMRTNHFYSMKKAIRFSFSHSFQIHKLF